MGCFDWVRQASERLFLASCKQSFHVPCSVVQDTLNMYVSDLDPAAGVLPSSDGGGLVVTLDAMRHLGLASGWEVSEATVQAIPSHFLEVHGKLPSKINASYCQHPNGKGAKHRPTHACGACLLESL